MSNTKRYIPYVGARAPKALRHPQTRSEFVFTNGAVEEMLEEGYEPSNREKTKARRPKKTERDDEPLAALREVPKELL